MSSLPATNGEVAQEWVRRARLYHDQGVHAREMGDTKVAVKHFTTAAEMALKAVYIKHETWFPRTHSTPELIAGCPDPTARRLLVGYSTEFVARFSDNYLAVYLRDEPVPPDEVEACRVLAQLAVQWATEVIGA